MKIYTSIFHKCVFGFREKEKEIYLKKSLIHKVKQNLISLNFIFNYGFSYSSGLHLISLKLGIRFTYYFFIHRLHLIYSVCQVYVFLI